MSRKLADYFDREQALTLHREESELAAQLARSERLELELEGARHVMAPGGLEPVAAGSQDISEGPRDTGMHALTSEDSHSPARGQVSSPLLAPPPVSAPSILELIWCHSMPLRLSAEA